MKSRFVESCGCIALLFGLGLAQPTAAVAGAPFPPPALATVTVAGESFVIRIVDPALLDQVYLIATGGAPQRIVVGQIATGNGGYNADVATPGGSAWSWHLDENALGLAEITIELCDGLPSHVEAASVNFAGGTYCPWSSTIVSVVPDGSVGGDTNVDGAVDQADADRVAGCFTTPPESCFDLAAGCCQGDIDSDRDVDCADWAVVESQWSAGGSPAVPAQCALAPPGVPTGSVALVLIAALAVLGARKLP